jgi:hypothetical protein
MFTLFFFWSVQTHEVLLFSNNGLGTFSVLFLSPTSVLLVIAFFFSRYLHGHVHSFVLRCYFLLFTHFVYM